MCLYINITTIQENKVESELFTHAQFSAPFIYYPGKVKLSMEMMKVLSVTNASIRTHKYTVFFIFQPNKLKAKLCFSSL